MGATVGLLLLTLLCASVSGVQGECRHVKNDDMIEYSCEGGQLSDLDGLPDSTGKIRITNMPISRITRNTFSRFGSELWVLAISHCGIVDIEPGAFEHLINLQQLSLDNNYLTAVEESWFRGLNDLTFLDLNFNNIHTIEDGVFKNLPSLIDLRLSGNRLECLNLSDMAHLKLQRMFLSENSEFKCPNAVSSYLEDRGVMFERDPEWNKIPNDLVPVETPLEYEDVYDETTSVPTTQLPMHRERLHPASRPSTPRPMESTPTYPPLWFYTTEDVVYHPMRVTPDWRTTQRPSTIGYEDTQSFTTTMSPYDIARGVHVPPRVIPVQTTTDTLDINKLDNLDLTVLGPRPSFPESTNARPEFPIYTGSDPFPLAPGPNDRHETPPSVDSNVDRTADPPEVAWPDRNTWDREYPPAVDNRLQGQETGYSGPPEYRVPPTVAPPSPTHVVRPQQPEVPETVRPAWPEVPETVQPRWPEVPETVRPAWPEVPETVQPGWPEVPETVQPAWPEIIQTPYYEHPITVHTPPVESLPPGQVAGLPPIETTTDKPLPNCGRRNLSSTMERSFVVIFISVLLVYMGDVLVEGF
ncbi:uncharacterized protein LOC128895076 [Hylaeus anthracinus]|uniref:uncharacterized protein LOC128895076 n=1 Tax=Hylaeus anthracinus TaxID=313031 RepID=UPI0023BA1C15|nr:uncharacterized protein LOC128895076 [Hylaeus anthracinus]